MTQGSITPRVTVGVDTHKDIHVAVVLDQHGRRLDSCSVPTTMVGLRELERWSSRHGQVDTWGIEGTSSYGAGLTRQLLRRGHRVREVSRPDRRARRGKGRSDLIDAELAARSVIAGTDLGAPKETRTRAPSPCECSARLVAARSRPERRLRICSTPWSPPPQNFGTTRTGQHPQSRNCLRSATIRRPGRSH